MADNMITKAEHKASREVDHLADRATEMIGSAAGAVADPKTGLSKLRARAMSPKALLLLVVVLVVMALVVLKGSVRR